MNKFYRKPKPETMKANRDVSRTQYKEEMFWLKDNLTKLGQYKNKFLVEMYTIMVSGSRKLTPKMVSSIREGIERCKKNPKYNPELLEEANEKFKPVISKINMVLAMAEAKQDKAIPFVRNILEYVKNNFHITKKQMNALNKVYKRVSDDLFEKGDK
jgi:esterase/lipase